MDSIAEELRRGAPAMPCPRLGRGGWRDRIKRCGDVSLSLALLVFCAPLMLAIAAAIKAQDGGPVLFRHHRCGRGGTTFGLWKFRTMRVDAAERLATLLAEDPDAEAEWIRTRKLRSDPRVTRLGRWLRKTSLDEVPQLFNILRGDMSVVGPRPVMGEELAAYGAAGRAYEAVRPGVTGLWQVSGRNDLSFEARVTLDEAYVREWSLSLDAVILARTVPVVLTARGAY